VYDGQEASSMEARKLRKSGTVSRGEVWIDGRGWTEWIPTRNTDRSVNWYKRKRIHSRGGGYPVQNRVAALLG